MTKVMTTKMSSKGQVVLPEALRQMYGWESGTAFTILSTQDRISVILLKNPHKLHSFTVDFLFHLCYIISNPLRCVNIDLFCLIDNLFDY